MNKIDFNPTVSAGEFVRQFSHYCDVALNRPVTVTKNGRPRNVLLSAEEYDRLKNNDRNSVMAADIPEKFMPQLRALARGKRRKA
ncbi:MAG TPA: type II toxin-antitoxin system prevent-host-death family antitoxin [Rhizomicrobium sp.]|nr:type II toxin-antitoxin system prevent-host-death family antitoxin [Rhizomicrobium sp.]